MLANDVGGVSREWDVMKELAVRSPSPTPILHLTLRSFPHVSLFCPPDSTSYGEEGGEHCRKKKKTRQANAVSRTESDKGKENELKAEIRAGNGGRRSPSAVVTGITGNPTVICRV